MTFFFWRCKSFFHGVGRSGNGRFQPGKSRRKLEGIRSEAGPNSGDARQSGEEQDRSKWGIVVWMPTKLEAGLSRSGGTPAVRLVLLLLATFLIRAVHAGQPIVENYVGRQVPTAMVARNLERGSGLLWPQLDTAPFPNFFLVEPPLYEAGVVALKRATGLSLEEAGRVLSALATALAAWGLFELARPREGRRVALLAVSAFAVFPLTIRYGRAFQPDAAMLGAVVAGLACWDRYRSGRQWYWLAAGWSLVALGFALKITAAFLLVPLLFVIAGARRRPAVLAACSTLLPALLWYAWADHLVEWAAGSRASADNRSIWLGLLGPSALLKTETWKFVGWFLLVPSVHAPGCWSCPLRALESATSPSRSGPALAGLGDLGVGGDGVSRGKTASRILLDGRGAGRRRGSRARAGTGSSRTTGPARSPWPRLCFCSARRKCASTWRTPAEWNDLEAAASTVETTVPRDAWIVAPEALLFQADRRGCRMEWTTPAVRTSGR